MNADGDAHTQTQFDFSPGEMAAYHTAEILDALTVEGKVPPPPGGRKQGKDNPILAALCERDMVLGDKRPDGSYFNA